MPHRHYKFKKKGIYSIVKCQYHLTSQFMGIRRANSNDAWTSSEYSTVSYLLTPPPCPSHPPCRLCYCDLCWLCLEFVTCQLGRLWRCGKQKQAGSRDIGESVTDQPGSRYYLSQWSIAVRQLKNHAVIERQSAKTVGSRGGCQKIWHSSGMDTTVVYVQAPYNLHSIASLINVSTVLTFSLLYLWRIR